ncbi:hypothetical protein AX15_003503 [Amanita polypyramis BW_CC]|nr:hypothetical protein AX15_003503 [Amanita polypyramis BW_CC]
MACHLESSCKNSPLNRHQVTEAIQKLNIIPAISLCPTIEGQNEIPAPRTIATYHATEASFNGKGYQCSFCSRTFSALCSLDSHLNSPAHDRKEFKCPKCKRKFKLISGLTQHLESGSCGLSSIGDVEERFREMITAAQFPHVLQL